MAIIALWLAVLDLLFGLVNSEAWPIYIDEAVLEKWLDFTVNPPTTTSTTPVPVGSLPSEEQLRTTNQPTVRMFTTTAPSSSTVTTTLPKSTATAGLSLDALDLESFSLDKVLRFTTGPAGAGELPGAQGTDEVHSESTKALFSAEQLKNMNLDRTLAPWDSAGTPPTEIKEPLSDGVEENVAQTKRSVVDSGSPSAENSKILVAVLVIAAGVLAIVCLQLAAMVVWFCRWHQTTKATVDGGARAGQAGNTPAAEDGPGDDAQRLDIV